MKEAVSLNSNLIRVVLTITLIVLTINSYGVWKDILTYEYHNGIPSNIFSNYCTPKWMYFIKLVLNLIVTAIGVVWLINLKSTVFSRLSLCLVPLLVYITWKTYEHFELINKSLTVLTLAGYTIFIFFIIKVSVGYKGRRVMILIIPIILLLAFLILENVII